MTLSDLYFLSTFVLPAAGGAGGREGCSDLEGGQAGGQAQALVLINVRMRDVASPLRVGVTAASNSNWP